MAADPFQQITATCPLCGVVVTFEAIWPDTTTIEQVQTGILQTRHRCDEPGSTGPFPALGDADSGGGWIARGADPPGRTGPTPMADGDPAGQADPPPEPDPDEPEQGDQ